MLCRDCGAAYTSSSAHLYGAESAAHRAAVMAQAEAITGWPASSYADAEATVRADRARVARAVAQGTEQRRFED